MVLMEGNQLAREHHRGRVQYHLDMLIWAIMEERTTHSLHSSYQLVYSSSYDATPFLGLLRRIILNPVFLIITGHTCVISHKSCQSGDTSKEIRNCIPY